MRPDHPRNYTVLMDVSAASAAVLAMEIPSILRMPAPEAMELLTHRFAGAIVAFLHAQDDWEPPAFSDN